MFDIFGGNNDPMAKVDTAWLRMERPTNLMMITGVMLFDGQLDVSKLRELIQERFLKFKRFRQKAVDRPSGAHWENDVDFDIEYHVRLTALPGDADKPQLLKLASHLASSPLDPARPLWQFQVVENYQGGTAVITRIHHCYADGIALIQVLLSMTDTVRNPRRLPDPREARLPHLRTGVVQRLLNPARDGLDAAVRLGMKAAGEVASMVKNPARAAGYVKEGSEIAAELANAILLSDDPKTRFRGRLGPRKTVAWCEPIPLHDVKAVARATGCKVNDVLIAAVCGAIRGYMLNKGDSVDGLDIRATVPVNLRPLEHAKELGNQFGLVFLGMPIGIENPIKRLYEVNRRMEELKSSKQATVSFGLLAALGMGPAAIQAPALEMLSRKATTVLTNVPGPQRDLYLAGTRMKQIMFWVPQTGSIGMGISILSYNWKVQFGLITDVRLVPDPQSIIDRFEPEFEKLVLACLMGTGDARPDASLAEHWLQDTE